MDFKRQTDELNRIPVHTVGAMLGIKLPVSGGSRCPFPDHADKKPSFQIGDTGLRWICFGCNRKGGSIDLVKEFLAVDFVAAKEWLLEQTARAPQRLRTAPVKPQQDKEAHEDGRGQPERPADAELFEAFLNKCPLQSDGRAYLTRRAISASTIKTFRIGQLRQSGPVLKELLNQFGFERTERSGVLTRASTPTRQALVFRSDSLVFPFVEGGIIAAIQARYFGDGAVGVSWQNLRGRRHRIYNQDAIYGPDKRIGICEGVMDTLSAVELGQKAIGLMGVSGKLRPDQMQALSKKDVEILLDWDPPGEARADTLQAELARFGVAATRRSKPSPTAGDLNDYLIERQDK